ncbi:hypothetical protein [Alteromonas stellipolaris]|uniref:hypothetical protein n=1 Tax=Alteromonas stellipolaris TaxID=233316 RepID=UPI002735E274|nr:hypothetical protein [Alteromonas stellipolaris]MDP2535600.1 hypothetical protein [Alteromonas stellipolaris]
MKSWTQPTGEMIEKVLGSVKKETDRQYFFSRLKNPLWLEPIKERGYLSNPPSTKHLPDGYVQYPHWPELDYLVNITNEAPDSVIDTILSLPKSDNPRVYESVLSIALKLEGEKSLQLLPKVIEYIDLGSQFLAHQFPDLLKYWAEQGGARQALEIAKLLISFKEDPKARQKDQMRQKNPNSRGCSLEPLPLFGEWEYQQILEVGVRPIIEQEPSLVALDLIEVVDAMIRLGTHFEDIAKGRDEDYSEIWCRRVDKPDRDYQTVKETLVHTLTFACEKVFEKDLESRDVLDQQLRKPRWKLFTRLRQHLYALYPNKLTLPWIREQILGHDAYSKWDHHYEFQLMIRTACEHFGNVLLCEAELQIIFDSILSGPSKEDFQEWLGEDYTDEAFQKRQRYFHRIQLRPFSSLLSSDIREYFEELEAEGELIDDESYAPHGDVKGGTVSYQSPKAIEEFDNLSDEEILSYINTWNEERRDEDNWLVEINFSALANVFQSFFKDQIVPDEARLSFWFDSRELVERPIYIAAILKALSELIKEKNFTNLEQSIEFCKWVLSLSTLERVEGQPEPKEESYDHPDWSNSHRAVVDFIDICVSKEVNVPIQAKEGLQVLLQITCNLPDWRLDQCHQVLLNKDDPIAEAINNTRSRALESLINFAFWVRRYSPEYDSQEIVDILDKRLDGEGTALTKPEKALLGMHYGSICTLNRLWAAEHVADIFPQGSQSEWRNSFGNYLRYSRPAKNTFEILRSEYEYAINNLYALGPVDENNANNELINKLGQHVFTYYLWEVYSLSGKDSLLELFYEKTSDNRNYWGKLFDHIGRISRNSGKNLDKSLTNRIMEFFDWRFEIRDPIELQEFTFWLEAECLDANWRLSNYSKILEHKQVKSDLLSLQVRTLNRLSNENLALALECFTKITDSMVQGSQMYIRADDAKGLMKKGLEAEDPQLRENAKRARENLLRLGRLDYMDI